MKNSEILELKISTYDFDEITVKQFFVELLKTLWEEGESFSGKRPFGSSSWEYNLARSIGIAGGFPVVNEGSDEDPDWVLEDKDAAMIAISDLLNELVLSCAN